MAKLTIGGKTVKVDDSFLSLSPEEQQRTVDEIAGSLGGQAMPQQQAAPEQPLDPQWSDLPGNIPQSAHDTAANLYQAVSHPIDTITALNDAAMGGIERLRPQWLKDANAAVMPSWSQPNQETLGRQQQVSGLMGQALKDRYGGLENLKRTAITDPVGGLLDVSALATGGGALAARLPMSGASAVGRGLLKAGELTNPLNAVIKPVQGAALLGESLAGATTGSGGSALMEAFRAGKQGGKASKALTGNMRGKVPQDAVIDQAKGAMMSMADERKANYLKGMTDVKADTTPIDMTPIDQAYISLSKSLFEGGVRKADKATLKTMQEIGDSLDEVRANPTPIKLDAIKQRIANEAPNFTQEVGQQGRVITAMTNAIKDAIVQQRPEYAGVMKDYATAKGVEKEITSALSLGRKSSKDTSLRKLQSVFRNNASTNYGSRVDNAKLLEKYGADTIMPSLAGQQLNSVMPRGLMKLATGGGLLGLAMNPALWPVAVPALAATSPRLMGEIFHATGKAGGKVGRVAKKAGVTKKNAVRAAIAGRSEGLLGHRQ
jgi:hypothetical protein